MSNYIKQITAMGLYNRFDIEQKFHPGINILHGKNGTGKTTLLHILTNILNGDYRRFAFLPFEEIEVILDDNHNIHLRTSADKKNSSQIYVYVDGEQTESFSIQETREMLRLRTPTTAKETREYFDGYAALAATLPTAYFPAFRTLIEASGDVDDLPYDVDYYTRRNRPLRQDQIMRTTILARRFFGNFVPWITYPSPQEVGRRLSGEMQQALNVIARTDRQLLSKAFLDIFATLSKETTPSQEQPEAILEDIRLLFEKLEETTLLIESASEEEVYTKLRGLVRSFQVRPGTEHVYVPILDVYRKSLEERSTVQATASQATKIYLDSVNQFFEEQAKKIALRRDIRLPSPALTIQFSDGSYGQVQALSSGERQIITLIYSATHMSGQKVVLVDEPEISLHIDWQRLLLPKMAEQLQDRQIITCTHSPMVGADYEERMIELEIKPTTRFTQSKFEVDEDPDEGTL